MADIDADYLGGDPDQALAGASGKLTVSGGAVSFAGSVIDGMTTRKIDGPRLAADQVRAMSVGSANQMQALTRGAAGVLIGGAIGGLIGMATSRRSTIILIAAERDGFQFVCSFGASGQDASWLLEQVQRGRRDRGQPALPTLEQLASREVADADAQQAQLLGEIRDLLQEQVGLLRKLVER
jgi:hypothetical protein